MSPDSESRKSPGKSSPNQPKGWFHEIMLGMSAAYRQQLNQQAVDWFWKSLQKYPQEKIEWAIKDACEVEERFPTIAVIKKRLDADVVNSPKSQEEWPGFQDLRRSAITPMAKEALALIFEKLEGNLSPEMFYDAMIDMERRYPGVGWEFSAHEYLRKANEYKSHSDSWHKDPNRSYYHKPACPYATGEFQNPENCTCKED